MSIEHRPPKRHSFEFWWRQYRRDVLCRELAHFTFEQMDALLMPAAKAAFHAGFKKGFSKGADRVETELIMASKVAV